MRFFYLPCKREYPVAGAWGKTGIGKNAPGPGVLAAPFAMFFYCLEGMVILREQAYS
jgi:hypothetical protein